ncbi:hypothetical protein TELCIR_08677, partial [Teladorsagia circumcincta]
PNNYHEMDELEHLSLVSKVCTELDNHFGIKDKDVAEFIIELATKNNTYEKFKRALDEQGLGEQFDDSLTANLLRLIQHMLPKKKSQQTGMGSSHKITLISDAKEEIKARLPALALPNSNTEDMMSQLENLVPKWKEAKKEEVTEEETPRAALSTSLQREKKRTRSRSRKDQHHHRSRSRSKRRGLDRLHESDEMTVEPENMTEIERKEDLEMTLGIGALRSVIVQIEATGGLARSEDETKVGVNFHLYLPSANRVPMDAKV